MLQKELKKMAKITPILRQKILADFHTGYFSIRALGEKYNIGKSTIAKITKGIEPKHKEKVDTLVSINTDLNYANKQEVDSVHSIVKERTAHLAFFQNSALKNQKYANKKINENSELQELKLHSEITQKNKISVLGRDVDTQINMQQNQNTQNVLEIRYV